MIKIERSTAINPTILRNGVRQLVTLSMVVTQAELDTLEAESGSIMYSVDELEVKTVEFQPSQPATPPAAEPTAPAEPVPAAKVTKPIVQPVRKTPRA